MITPEEAQVIAQLPAEYRAEFLGRLRCIEFISESRLKAPAIRQVALRLGLSVPAVRRLFYKFSANGPLALIDGRVLPRKPRPRKLP